MSNYQIPNLNPKEINHSFLASMREMKTLGLPLTMIGPKAAAYIHRIPEDDYVMLEVEGIKNNDDVTHVVYFKPSGTLWINRSGTWEKIFLLGDIFFWTSKFNEFLAKKRGYTWQSQEE